MTVLLRMQMTKHPLFSIRQWREVCREAHRDVGRHWQKTMLRKHFEPGARGRYGYKPRTERYMRRKAQSGHGTTDLIYTGAMREYLMSSGVVRPYPTRVTITMYGPKYVKPNPGGRRANMPFLAGEVLSWDEQDREEMEDVFRRSFEQRYARALDTYSDVLELPESEDTWA